MQLGKENNNNQKKKKENKLQDIRGLVSIQLKNKDVNRFYFHCQIYLMYTSSQGLAFLFYFILFIYIQHSNKFAMDQICFEPNSH